MSANLFFIMVLFLYEMYGLIEVYIRLSETVKNFISGGNSMGKLLLTGVDGNLGAEAANTATLFSTSTDRS